MQQQPEREAYPTKTPTPTIRPAVLGMSANMSFAQGGLVTVNVMIAQDSTPDDSSAFVLHATQDSQSVAVSPLNMQGAGTYTASTALVVELDVDNSGVTRTLSTTIPASEVVLGGQPTFQLQNPNGTETLDGSAHLLSAGRLVLTLDLSSDSQLSGGGATFTLKAAPSGTTPTRCNLTYLQGSASYVDNEEYTVKVSYEDNNDDAQTYDVTAPADDVHANGYYTNVMRKQ